MEKEKTEKGITGLIGYVHSHPGNVKGFVTRFLLSRGNITNINGGFSPGDLCSIIRSSDTHPWFCGVVDKTNNYFSFVTRETEIIPPDSELYDTQKFHDHWLKKVDSSPIFQNSIFIVKSQAPWEVNIEIAKQYKLALYRGIPGEELVRGFP